MQKLRGNAALKKLAARGIVVASAVPKWNTQLKGGNRRRPKKPGTRQTRQRLRVRKQNCEYLSAEEVDPIYLFACAISWRTADITAGWELIRYLRDEHAPNWIARALCQEIGFDDIMPLAWDATQSRGEDDSGEPTMNTPYGLAIIENCASCTLRKSKWFCGLSAEVLKAFSAVGHLSTYPNGAVLFVEGQLPRGAFILCSGRVKLSTTSREGKVLILKVAEPGETLGLSAVIGGNPCELTAETSGPCQVKFIDRATLLKLIERYGELGLHSAQALSHEFQSAYRDIHELVLARSSAGKLARLLLSWTSGREKEHEVKIRSSLTHEEMAQMIGSSRETVTRLLSDMKKKEFIRLEGSVLVIRNRPGLEALAA